jgi:hypothetical protein
MLKVIKVIKTGDGLSYLMNDMKLQKLNFENSESILKYWIDQLYK